MSIPATTGSDPGTSRRGQAIARVADFAPAASLAASNDLSLSLAAMTGSDPVMAEADSSRRAGSSGYSRGLSAGK